VHGGAARLPLMDLPPLRTSDFDFALPPELVAQHPAARRDESRLLVLERATGALHHRSFGDIVEWIPPGDLVVINETKVFPARLLGRRASGGEAEILLLRPEAEDARVWRALVRPGSRLKPGRRVEIADGFSAEILDSSPEGERRVRLETEGPLEEALERHGRVPLPPYIEREAGAGDRERYQTVYARERGSVAAPTAGLHFTPGILAALEGKGVEMARLVLHVGVGTFRPVEVEDPGAHRMHAEWYSIPEATAGAVNAARAGGRGVWAVGTTTVRTLEAAAAEDGRLRAGAGWTDIFIRPPHRFRAVDHLLTNFHLPRSTLLMLVSALAGREAVLDAYREAVERRYRFFSYGDAMLVV
jgi:S-adenosylmethionine:tRNA ribosyltransferase-isomerase